MVSGGVTCISLVRLSLHIFIYWPYVFCKMPIYGFYPFSYCFVHLCSFSCITDINSFIYVLIYTGLVYSSLFFHFL